MSARDPYAADWEIRKIGSHETVFVGDDYSGFCKKHGLSKGNLCRTTIVPGRRWFRSHTGGYYLIYRGAY